MSNWYTSIVLLHNQRSALNIIEYAKLSWNLEIQNDTLHGRVSFVSLLLNVILHSDKLKVSQSALNSKQRNTLEQILSDTFKSNSVLQ